MATRVTNECEQIPLNVVGSSIFGRYPKISTEATYNMFESDGWLVDFPAYHKVVNNLGAGRQGRSLFVSIRGNIMVAVVDSAVYRIDSTLYPTFIGNLNTTVGEVFMDENLNSQICIVDGRDMWIYNWMDYTFTQQTDGTLTADQLIPNYVTFHNNYFLIGNNRLAINSSFWYVYEFDTPTTVVQVTAISLSTKPDFALAVERIPGQGANVLALGTTVCEIQTQIPNSLTTYERNQSISIDYGCKSVSTISSSDNILCFLGINQTNSPVIVAVTGQTSKRISTDGIDYLLDNLEHPEISTAMMYSIDGHLFYHLTFFYVDPTGKGPSDNLSLLYDFNNEKFYNVSDQNLNFHPARQVVYFNGRSYFISIDGGNIYELSTNFTFINEDISDPNGEYVTDPRLHYEMQRIRICQNIRFPTSVPFRANQIVITLEQGCDNIDAVQDCIILMITEDNIRMFSEYISPYYPSVQLVPERAGQEDCESHQYQGRIDCSISKDGGQTFGNYVGRLTNPTGIRKNILRWNKLGNTNDLVIKFRFWSLGRFVVHNGIVEISP